MTDQTTLPVLLRSATEILAHKLTQVELLEAGNQLAEVVQDIDAEADRQKQIKSSLTAKMSALESKRSELSIKVARQEEQRETPVEFWLFALEREVQTIRTDTGEQIHKRPAQERELQMAIDDTPTGDLDLDPEG